MTKGQWIEPLRQMVAKLSDLAVLEYIGMTATFAAVPYSQAHENSPMVKHEDEIARQIMTFVNCVLEHRGTTQQWYSDCWPGLAPNVCNSNSNIANTYANMITYNDCNGDG